MDHRSECFLPFPVFFNAFWCFLLVFSRSKFHAFMLTCTRILHWSWSEASRISKRWSRRSSPLASARRLRWTSSIMISGGRWVSWPKMPYCVWLMHLVCQKFGRMLGDDCDESALAPGHTEALYVSSRPTLVRVVFLNWVPTCRKVKRDGTWKMPGLHQTKRLLAGSFWYLWTDALVEWGQAKSWQIPDGLFGVFGVRGRRVDKEFKEKSSPSQKIQCLGLKGQCFATFLCFWNTWHLARFFPTRESWKCFTALIADTSEWLVQPIQRILSVPVIPAKRYPQIDEQRSIAGDVLWLQRDFSVYLVNMWHPQHGLCFGYS